MTTAGPWSVKGIDPKAREIAKDLARRSGLTLGEWLNQMIVEGVDEAPPAYADAPPERDAGAVRGWSEAPRASAWRETAAAAPGLNTEALRSRLREAGRGADPAEAQRVAKALTDLTARIEAAEHRSTLAISGIDQQTMGVLSRLEGVERDQTSVAARFDGSLDELRAVQTRMSERLRRMDEEDAPRLEAMKALEGALGKVAAQIYEGESRARAQSAEIREDVSALVRRMDRAEAAIPPPVDTSAIDGAISRLAERMDDAQARTGAAVRALESSFAGLDQRIARAETPLPDSGEAERRFGRLAAELTERVDGARAEIASRLRDAADGKFDRMESALRDLTGQVAESEKRSAGAIDRMGREVVRIAQGLDGRMSEVDRRSQAATAEMEGGMARIADAVETRLARADSNQAAALEKLGGEIARIAEKLADRIAASERRAAADLTRGLDEVGEKLGRATDKLNNRYDHAAADLAERIRASEERTARLLDDARSRIEARRAQVASAPDATPEPPAREPDAFPAAAAPLPTVAQEPLAIEDLDAFSPGPFTSPAEEIDRFESTFQPGPFGRPTFAEGEDRYASGEPGGFEVDDDFGPAPPPPAAAGPARPGSTRELIEQARAAARSNAEARLRRPSRTTPSAVPPASQGADPLEELFAAPAPGFEAEAEPALKSRFALPRLRRRETSTAKTALLASGVAAFVSVTAVAAVWMVGESGVRAPTTAEAPSAAPGTAPTLLAVAETPPASIPSAMVEPTPLKTDEFSPVAPPPAADARALYGQAVRDLERGEAGGLQALRRAADLGYAPAQFHLGKLYEDGSSGLKKDMGQARRWTERAARAGDPKAMFNLGLYLANGEGAGRDDKAAVEWFRRAADGGVKDAQFNLAVMHQNGRGAPASPVEAYKWFLIAAADGDAGARVSAEALKASLGLDARVAAERSAIAYRAQTAAAQVRTAAR